MITIAIDGTYYVQVKGSKTWGCADYCRRCAFKPPDHTSCDIAQFGRIMRAVRGRLNASIVSLNVCGPGPGTYWRKA